VADGNRDKGEKVMRKAWAMGIKGEMVTRPWKGEFSRKNLKGRSFMEESF
jgi:hypothetical protein